MGKYTVHVEDFESIALPVLNDPTTPPAAVIVVDEIGKMENFSRKFQALTRQDDRDIW